MSQVTSLVPKSVKQGETISTKIESISVIRETMGKSCSDTIIVTCMHFRRGNIEAFTSVVPRA